MKYLLTLAFILFLTAGIDAQCNLTLKDAPILREGLRLGMDIGTVDKAFPLTPNKEKSTEGLKVGSVNLDDVDFDLYFRDDQLSYISGKYQSALSSTAADFMKILAARFHVPGRSYPYYDSIGSRSGVVIYCRDFAVITYPYGEMAMVNFRLIRQLKAKDEAERAAALRAKIRTFKP